MRITYKNGLINYNMKIEKFEGCTSDRISIEGKPLEDYAPRDLCNIINRVLERTNVDHELLYTIIDNIVYSLGEAKCEGKCEQCGDLIFKYTFICE